MPSRAWRRHAPGCGWYWQATGTCGASSRNELPTAALTPARSCRACCTRTTSLQVLLPPTSSIHIAGRRLARFDTGGKTPLAQGLLAARDVVVREKARDRARRSLVVVLTDGRATGGPDPLGRARVAAARLVAEGAAAVVIDCETSYVRLGLAEELAMQLGAPSVRLSQLRADSLTQIVRTQSSAA